MCSTKTWGLSAPLLCIAMGITGLAISVYMYTFEDYSYVLAINNQYGMTIILTVFSGITLLIGCIGVCAVYQLNTTMLTLFWIMLLLCVFGFAAGAAVGLATPILFQMYGCAGQAYPAVYSISNQTTQAEKQLCNTSCNCFIDPTGQFNRTSNASVLSSLNSTVNRTQPISVIQCPLRSTGIYDRSIAFFQTSFNCSGWCTKGNRYLFSDINRGVPTSACFDSLASWFSNYAKYCYITCFIFCVMSLILVIWICVFQRFCLADDPEYAEVLEARSTAMI